MSQELSSTNSDLGMTTLFDGSRATVKRLRKAKIVVSSGDDSGKEYDIKTTKVVGGRASVNEIILSDTAVSGSHFEIIVDDVGFRLVDLGSRNGTYVGDYRIKDIFLKPGMSFRVGQTVMTFQPVAGSVDIPLSGDDRFGSVLGSSVAMREIFAALEKIAPSELTVLINGETGTGKELIANSILDKSKRASKPFVVLDCGSIPKDLVESTLFGHEKGAFTGAVSQHRGCFEQSNGGTIFLDEIGELPITLQPKLLRVLENRELKRVGGDRKIDVDVRVIAATNRDLREMVGKGTFREDLYFRVSVVNVVSPPLRNRKEDVPQLVNAFLSDASARKGKKMTISVDAMGAMTSYAWPGNVRELRNVIERACALADGTELTRSDISLGRTRANGMSSSSSMAAPSSGSSGAGASAAGLDASLFGPGVAFKVAKQSVVEGFERTFLTQLLVRHSGNITRSAQEAELTRYHLRELIKRHDIKVNRGG